jgi:D-tagatose-bisphosphate aldolase class II non-catalytic subunit
MTPAAFRRFAEGLARAEGVDPARIILGGDHLGPNPWRGGPEAAAMDKARAMVAAYVKAGFTKIHLDASMRCADDGPLSQAVMAARAADLAAVAEAQGRDLHYVIGTEVPVPGGETEAIGTLAATRPEAVTAMLDAHREAFGARGLSLDRVVAVVVQPGVDFGNEEVAVFDPPHAAGLVAAVPGLGGPVYEAHSTDYQPGAALAGLVAAHFGILKVGPELTFAYREAMFAADGAEDLIAALTAEMQAHPADWRAHVAEGPDATRLMLTGLSDRVRYYWPRPAVQDAVARLMARGEPQALIDAHVGAVVARYRTACGETHAPQG